MGNIVLSYNVAGRGASVEAVGNELASAPVSNLFLHNPGDLWQSSGLTNLWFELQMSNAPGALTPRWDFFVLLYTNATTTDTWRIRSATTQAGLTTGPIRDTGNQLLYKGSILPLTPWRDSILRPTYILFDAGAVRTEAWVRIDITSTAPEGYFRAGNLIIDEVISPARNFETPLDIGPPARITLRDLSEADAMTLQEAMVNNEDEPLLAVFDPDETFYLQNMMIWGHEEPSNVRQVRSGLWSKHYTIHSLL